MTASIDAGSRAEVDRAVIMQTRGLRKEFKGFVAVNDVSISVRRGEIHALIGPNGAGKTTFFNLLTKFLPPTAGQIIYNGCDITADKPAQTARRGIVRSFQISAVFPHMTVMENVRVALQRNLGTSFYFWKPESSLSLLNDRALQLLAEVGLEPFADTPTVELPYGRKRALEIATTLALEPELMLLDEPTQGMGHEDVGRVTELIRKVSADRTILMVEHNMNVVASIADTITVLARGAVLAEGPYAVVSKHPKVVEAYMGTEAAAVASSFGGAHGVDFSVREGEVVTLLGRNGSGRTTTLRAIMGLVGRRGGSIRVGVGETIRLASHRIARMGVGYCPEERGIFSTLSADENLRLPPTLSTHGSGLVGEPMPVDEIYAMFPNLKERAASPGTRLSGGEQQMLAVARILRTGARLLLLDEISEGLAPVIVQKLGEVIRMLKQKGYTVVLVEQNFRFAAPLADRFCVMEHGRIVKAFDQGELQQNMGMLHEFLGV